MGASSSKSENKSSTEIIESAYNNCGTASAINNIDIKNVKFYPPDDCKEDPEFDINQSSSVDGTCLISQLQDSAASSASELSSDAQADLGLSSSDGKTITDNDISEYTTNQCANYSSTNSATIYDTEVRSCKFQVVQAANANQSCQINATQTLVSDIDAKTTTTAEGGSLLGDLFGSPTNIALIIGAIILIMIIGGVGYYFYKKNSSQSGGFAKNMYGGDCSNPTYLIIVILIILLLVGIFLNFSKNKDKPMTEDDVNDINQKYVEAKIIAEMKEKQKYQQKQINIAKNNEIQRIRNQTNQNNRNKNSYADPFSSENSSTETVEDPFDNSFNDSHNDSRNDSYRNTIYDPSKYRYDNDGISGYIIDDYYNQSQTLDDFYKPLI